MSNPRKLYKDMHTLQERQQRVKEIKEKYPGQVPIIVEKGKTSKLTELLTRKLINLKIHLTGTLSTTTSSLINLN